MLILKMIKLKLKIKMENRISSKGILISNKNRKILKNL